MKLEVVVVASKDAPEDLVDQIDKAREGDSPNGELYAEQLLAISYGQGYLVVLMDTDINLYLGGTMLYLDRPDWMDIDTPAIQGIIKREVNGYNFRLNEMLLRVIIDMLKEAGYHKLWVEPYEKQSLILLTYGFKPASFGRVYLDF
jgi:hypothetical protein